MSERYPGGLITKTPPTPAGPVETGAAPGVWTLEQQAYWIKQGVWPTAGVQANYIEDVFSTYTYEGDSSSRLINNGLDLSGKGGLVWVKARSAGLDHYLQDTMRGADFSLASNTTGLSFSSGQLTAFNSNGFTLSGFNGTNGNGNGYVAWAFREQAKFFDVVAYTGTSSARTISHNLGSAPGCVIVKRTSGAVSDWQVYHRGLTSATNSIRLNLTNAQAAAATVWNSTAPTATAFSVGTDASVNASGSTYIAYLFAHDAGGFGLTGTDNVISCGSLVPDGSGNATVNLGWEPQFVILKNATTAGSNWNMLDVSRGWSMDNDDARLRPNTNDIEGTAKWGNPTATGFYLEAGTSGATYIYIAVRRGPMKVPTDPTKVFTTSLATTGTVSTSFPVDMQLFRVTDQAFGNYVVDRLRGVDTTNDGVTTEKDLNLNTTSTAAESAAAVACSNNWNSTGFNVPSSFSGLNDLFYSFRRAPGFFDEVCYTATNSGAFRDHNLRAIPELIIDKRRDATGTNDVWYTWHTSFGLTKNLQLNSTSSTTTSPVFITGGSDLPTTTTFFTESQVASTRVAYLFATCPGVSKVGSYTGTGALQTIACGFAAGARFVLIKRTDSTGDWYVWDSVRGISSGNDPYFLINSTAVQVTGTNYVDTTAAGFQVTAAAPAGINASGGSYIFLAIA